MSDGGGDDGAGEGVMDASSRQPVRPSVLRMMMMMMMMMMMIFK